jgi:hypothetical protein
MQRSRLVVALGALLVAVGCGSGKPATIDGAVSDGAEDVPHGADAVDATADVGTDAPADAKHGADAPVDVGGTACGFTMPNPASAGLPNPASYTANQDGTITDHVTGLMWEATPAADSFPIDQAPAHCAGKAGGWRLPTRLELVSLLDFTVPFPGPMINPIFANAPGDEFWTSTADATVGAPGSAWVVHFGVGYTASSFVEANHDFRVRCVRAPAFNCSSTRYQVSGGLVHDQTTGLTWQQTFTTASQTAGKTMCASLGPGWRLPSLTELQTLVDDNKFASPLIDVDAFPDVPHTPNDGPEFWTSTPTASDSIHAWFVDFNTGFTSDNFAAEAMARVRCVR